MRPEFILGLDLGQIQDFTALAVLQRLPAPPAAKSTYALRHLERFHLGTPYTEIVLAVHARGSTDALKGCALVVDQTGVGRPLVEMLRVKSPNPIVPVTITGGHDARQDDNRDWHVPKKALVTGLQLIFQSHRLTIPRTLAEADVLVKELQNFQVKITQAANEVFGSWRESAHDDLVLALALAAWWAEWHRPGVSIRVDGRGSIVDNALPGVFMSHALHPYGPGKAYRP